MKLLKQFLIIILVSFIGEILKEVIPFPVPASIYGMIIMFSDKSSSRFFSIYDKILFTIVFSSIAKSP